MSRGIMALEDDAELNPELQENPETDTAEVNDSLTEDEPNELGDSILELGEDEDAIEVVEAALDSSDDDLETLVQIDETVQEAPAEEPLTDKEQELVTIAVEHFRGQLGFKKKGVLAIESVDGKQQLSQEGIGSTIFNTVRAKLAYVESIFEAVVNIEGKYTKQLKALQKELIAAGKGQSASEDKVIKGDSFNNLLKPSDKSVKDAIKNLTEYNKHIRTIDYEKHVLDIATEFNKLIEIIRSIWVYSNSKEVAQLDKIIDDMSNSTLALVGAKAKSGSFTFGIGTTTTITVNSNDDDNVSLSSKKDKSDSNKNTNEFAPATDAEVKQLTSLVEELITHHEKNLLALVKMSQRAKKANGWSAINSFFRPGASLAQTGSFGIYHPTDLRRAAAAMRALSVARGYYSESFNSASKIARDAIRLIKQS